MMKSTRRASRCRMESICRAPSDGRGPTCVEAVCALGAPRRVRPSLVSPSSGRDPLNRIEKKLRMASQMRPKDRSNLQDTIRRAFERIEETIGANHTDLSRTRTARYYTDEDSCVNTLLRWATRIVASVALVAAIILVYYRTVPVNATTVALTLLLAILGIATKWGLTE